MEEKEFLQKIAYHKRMLDNLKKYITAGILMAGIGIALSIKFRILGIVVFVLSVIWLIVVGYAMNKGSKKANQLLDEYEKKMAK